MLKEKTINPAQAQRKAEKAKAIKKSKAEALSRRNEKLARRNPDRLQKQLDELKALESNGGKLTNHEKNVRDGLEKELRAVLKARENVGNSIPIHGTKSRKDEKGKNNFEKDRKRNVVLGKRGRADSDSSDDSDVPEEVKRIPMPKDTPPPISKEVLERWYQQRRHKRMGQDFVSKPTNANMTPLGENDRSLGNPDGSSGGVIKSTTPYISIQAQTVYEAKPVLRNLRKEAVAFVPTAVRAKLDKSKGIGGLVEPDEADKLEKEGYLVTPQPQP